MAHAHSFVITRGNLKTENEGLRYVLRENKNCILLNKQDRQEIIETFKIDKKYARAFDAILLKKRSMAKKIKINPTTAMLIEFKTTKKKLIENPRGFFFGATKNEFELAKKLGNKFRFCFVCLHPKSRSYKFLTYSELKKLIKAQRIQYQINL